jgi:TolA-binding protein
MISTRLSILMVAMTAFGAVSPMAAMAQEEDNDLAANVFEASNTVAQVADTSADNNVQVNNAEVKQSIENEAECDDRCGAEVNVDDQTQISDIEQENEIETGDVEQEQEDIEQENELEDIFAIALADLDLEL